MLTAARAGDDPTVIAKLRSGYAALHRSQFLPGYCLLLADTDTGHLTDLSRPAREQFLTDAVDGFLNALNADPYNVHATYNLAAAYARIKRPQCSLNMLERLVLMRDHHSRKVEVNQKLDRLLGRNKTPLDPDFNDLRQDKRFGCLINNMGSAQPVSCW